MTWWKPVGGEGTWEVDDDPPPTDFERLRHWFHYRWNTSRWNINTEYYEPFASSCMCCCALCEGSGLRRTHVLLQRLRKATRLARRLDDEVARKVRDVRPGGTVQRRPVEVPADPPADPETA